MTRTLFLVLQALHLLIYAVAVGHGDFAGMAVSGAVVVVLQSLLLYREIRRGQWAATPLVAYLVISTVRVGLASMYLAAGYMTGYGDEMGFTKGDLEAFITRGHLLLMAGEWLFLSGYFGVEYVFRRREQPVRLLFDGTGRSLLAAALALIAIGWALRIGGRFGVNLQALGLIAGIITRFTIPAGVFLLTVEAGRRAVAERIPIVVGLVITVGLELLVAFGSYMKSDMLFAILPLVVYFLERVRTSDLRKHIRWRYVLPLLVIGYFVVMVLFPFNSIRREMVWKVGENTSIASTLREAFMGAIPFTSKFAESHAFPNRGAWAFMARNEWTTLAAWAVERVSVEGTLGGQGIKDGFLVLIPRVFWPNKPIYAPAAEFTALLGHAQSAETATSATGLGLAATLYWNGSTLGLVAGMLINGAILALTWHVIRPCFLGNPAAAIMYFYVLIESFRWFEGQFDGCLSFYAFIWLVFIPMIYVIEIFTPKRVERPNLVSRAARPLNA